MRPVQAPACNFAAQCVHTKIYGDTHALTPVVVGVSVSVGEGAKKWVMYMAFELRIENSTEVLGSTPSVHYTTLSTRVRHQYQHEQVSHHVSSSHSTPESRPDGFASSPVHHRSAMKHVLPRVRICRMTPCPLVMDISDQGVFVDKVPPMLIIAHYSPSAFLRSKRRYCKSYPTHRT